MMTRAPSPNKPKEQYPHIVLGLTSVVASIGMLLYGMALLMFGPIALAFNDTGSTIAPFLGIGMIIFGVVYIRQSIRAMRAISLSAHYGQRVVAQYIMIAPAVVATIIICYKLQGIDTILWYLVAASAIGAVCHGYLLEDVID